MTESSFLWDSGGGGDASPHSEALTAKLFAAVFGATTANKGVVLGMLNKLAPTISGTNILMDTGYAVVDGHPYYNDSSKSTAITTPSVGTTGRRLVLRCSWSAQTVRATIISSADGTATIPSMTQTPGTTYDIPICQFTTTTGGVSTITLDDREYVGGEDVYTSIVSQFRLGIGGRRVVAWATPGATIASAGSPVQFGIGFSAIYGGAGGNISLYHVSGEPSIQHNHNAAEGQGVYSSVALLSPNKSPRLLARVQPAGSSANLTVWQCGFSSSQGSATADGAYLRIATTGNLFFVTRQGGAETTTDLGARPAALTSYEIYTDDAGVTWRCRNATTGALVATHTTNVPTVTTALIVVGYFGQSSGAASSGQFAYAYCDAKLAV